MTIYEIDNSIAELIDWETGEITDLEQLDKLICERDTKIENVACMIKNLVAESEMLKEEESKLAARRKVKENNVKHLKEYLIYALDGNKFESSRAKISFRKSKAVNIDNEQNFIEWAMENNDSLLTYKPPTVNKTAIKQALADGEIPHCSMAENVSVIIK